MFILGGIRPISRPERILQRAFQAVSYENQWWRCTNLSAVGTPCTAFVVVLLHGLEIEAVPDQHVSTETVTALGKASRVLKFPAGLRRSCAYDPRLARGGGVIPS